MHTNTLPLQITFAYTSLLVLIAGSLFVPAGPLQADEPNLALNGLSGLLLEGELNTSIYSRNWEDADGTERQSEVVVNETSLGLGVALGRYVDVQSTVLFEQVPARDETANADGDIVVESASILLADHEDLLLNRGTDPGGFPLYLRAGKFQLPFGLNMDPRGFPNLTEPQTVELAELELSSAKLGYYGELGEMPVNAFAGVFRGDHTFGTEGRTELNDYYLGVQSELHGVEWSVQYTNALTNGRQIAEELEDEISRTGGYNLYIRTDLLGPTTLQAEWIRASRDLPDDVFSGFSGDNGDLRPEALSAEWTLHEDQLEGLPVNLTAQYESTEDWPEHPDSSVGVVADRDVFTNTNLALQYLHRDFDEDLTDDELDEEYILAAQVTVGWGLEWIPAN